MPTKADLAIYQGDDYAAVVTVSDASGPLDLTGFTAQAQIRVGPADTSPVVVVEIDAELSLPSAINLTIPSGVTALLSGMYVWDLQVTDPGGVISTLLAGNVVVTQEVTREP